MRDRCILLMTSNTIQVECRKYKGLPQSIYMRNQRRISRQQCQVKRPPKYLVQFLTFTTNHLC